MVGHTMVVRYAESHFFADFSNGLRLEKTRFVRMIPASLAVLLRLDRRRNELLSERSQKNIPCSKCNTCHAPMSCSACGMVDYCSKKCQTMHWPQHDSRLNARLGVYFVMFMIGQHLSVNSFATEGCTSYIRHSKTTLGRPSRSTHECSIPFKCSESQEELRLTGS